MNHRLILIEGIPGSGKSTLSARLESWLNAQGIAAKLYSEGDAHPADLAWHAVLTPEEYQRVEAEHPHLVPALKQYTLHEDDLFIVAYTKLGYEQMGAPLNDFFAAYEVYDGRVPLDRFKQLHLKRWTAFAEKAAATPDTVYLFECAYLQNHVNELFGCHLLEEADILTHLNALADAVSSLNPLLLYLDQPDPAETVRKVAAERVSPPGSGRPDWIDLVIEYVESSHYGKIHGLKGYEGALAFFHERKRLEMSLWSNLRMEKHIIPNPDNNWDAVFYKMITVPGTVTTLSHTWRRPPS